MNPVCVSLLKERDSFCEKHSKSKICQEIKLTFAEDANAEDCQAATTP